jgi:pyruvate ferredoxin oxidoreductase beta subunit
MPSQPIPIRDIPYEIELLTRGHRAFPGCGMAIASRQALKILGKDTICMLSAGCFASCTAGPFPTSSIGTPAIFGSFGSTGAALSGIEAALKIKGRNKDFNVVAIAGDGGTADIGYQSLSAAIDRGHNIIYICYDNEAYMNTGIQKSGSTPYGAWTTTTPVGKLKKGKQQPKKPLAQLFATNGAYYSATASIAYFSDFLGKIRRAIEVTQAELGPAFIHIPAECPTGWRYPSERTVELARLAVLTGWWALYEIEQGKFKLNFRPKIREPVETCLRPQGRFRHFTSEDIAKIQERIDKDWEVLESEMI